jgi:thiamine-monophosphate kinase
VDVGDDTAAWRIGAEVELLTTDTMVEGIHFTTATTPWADVGWKALASNISDVASMGGRPAYAVVTLGLPADTPVSAIDDLYDGMLDIGREYETEILGGDIVRSPVAFVSIALSGIAGESLMLRSSATSGDRIGVTGHLGSSAGGLEVLLQGGESGGLEAPQELVQAHRRPRPRVAEGQSLLRAGVRTAMDVSDGLLDDLGKLCLASGVAGQVRRDSVPVHPALRRAFPERYLEMALNGGEDYELLFTAPSSVMERAVSELGGAAAIIGEVIEGTPGKVMLVDAAGNEVAPPRGGWDHFG